MKKYTLKRFQAFSLASVLAFTLSACGNKKSESVDLEQAMVTAAERTQEQLDELEKEKRELLERLEGIEAERERYLAENNRLKREIDACENILEKEELLEKLENCSFYSMASKNFFKAYIDQTDSSINFIVDLVSGNAAYLNGSLWEGNIHAPYTNNTRELCRPIYYKGDMGLFDNREGVIEDLPLKYMMLFRTNTYDSYSVYAVNSVYNSDYFIITDRDNRIVGHTYKGYTELYDANIKLEDFNKKLDQLGLGSLKTDVYSDNDIKNIMIAISKKLYGYQESNQIKTNAIAVIDTTTKRDFPHIYDIADCYFMEFMAPSAFFEDSYYYRDIFNSDATFVCNDNQNSFYYEYLDENDYLPFYFTEYDFENEYQAFKLLRDFLNDKGLGDINLGFTTNTSKLSEIYEFIGNDLTR